MLFFSGFFSGKASLGTLLQRHLVLLALVFALLEFWRPCYFLTDDNLCGFFPCLTEVGRHLKEGRSPFFSDYIFGGHYDLRRDISFLYWHPFYILPSLVADTPGRFCLIDVIAALLLLFGLAGFTVLVWRLREEWNPALPDFHLTFYTFSFLFCSYILLTGASWINFLGSESALPWLVLAVLEQRLFRSMAWVGLVTGHEILSGFLPLTFSIGLCLTMVAVAVAIHRRSPRPVLAWIAGNLLAVLFLSPLLARALDGFGHAARVGGLSTMEATRWNIPAGTVPFSFFAGNWTVPLAIWQGTAAKLAFPFISMLLACAAAWCIFPALINSARWRAPEKLCAGLCVFLLVLIIRPLWVSAAMHQLPFLKSMRWPFREALPFLFFLHLLFILRPVSRVGRLQPAAMIAGSVFFLLPLPFIPAPSFKLLAVDRAAVFSGQGQRFWDRVKARLAPGDEIITVIPGALWTAENGEVPYSFSGTANFPCLFGVVCASGYSASAPTDSVPLKTYPGYWFGAFNDTQLPEILAQKPHLVVIRVENVAPLKIAMTRDGITTDLTPLLPP